MAAAARWTKDQTEAIYCRNKNILVSAAAGSGKTAVLVERIVTLLKDPEQDLHLNRMMIVTFTTSAAAEMRERLKKRIQTERKDPLFHEQMNRALDELESASISTIHSFCQELIRSEFRSAGIDPNPRVCDDSTRKKLFDEAWRKAFNELAEREENGIGFLTEAASLKEIRDWTEQLYEYLMSIGDPFVWLRDKIGHLGDKPYEQQEWYRLILAEGLRTIDGLEDAILPREAMFTEEAAPQVRYQDLERELQAYYTLRDAVRQHPEQISTLCSGYQLPRATIVRNASAETAEWNTRYNAARDEVKKKIKAVGEETALDAEKNDREFPVIIRLLTQLADLTEATGREFDAMKRERSCIDFHDMEQLAYQLMKDSEIRQSVSGRYDHIFVDECQDVSRIQDAIIQGIHSGDNTLFMVGDVKQSIYRFRAADPTLFLGRSREFLKDEAGDCRAIALQQNFRSAPAVLDAANRVFRRILSADVTEIDYGPREELIHGRECGEQASVEVILAASEEKDNRENRLRAQACVVAKRIHRLIREGTYTYRDMVILMSRTAGVADKVVETLSNYGIPVYFDGSDSYADTPEINTFLNVLQTVENFHRDIPLLTTLKVTPFSLSEAELCDIRLCKEGKDVPFYEAFEACSLEDTPLGRHCADIRHTIREWKFRSENMGVTAFLWYMLHETGMLTQAGALRGGDARLANLKLLCQRAAELEDSTGCSLSRFIESVREKRGADDRAAKVLGEGEDLVKLMTVHKSKGLEFPVVFVMGLDDELLRSRGKTLQILPDLGVNLPYCNPALNIRRNTVLQQAFALRSGMNERAERARVLYVAMTRARDRMVLVGSREGAAPDTWRYKPGSYRTSRAKCMTDWIMQALMDECPDADPVTEQQETLFPGLPWSLTVERVSLEAEKERNESVKEELTGEDYHQALQELLHQKPDKVLFPEWNDIYETKPGKPLKTSVTSLLRQMHAQEEEQRLLALEQKEEEELTDKAAPATELAGMRLSEIPQAPAFLEKRQLTAAEGGTVNHRLMALFDLEGARKAEDIPSFVLEEVDRLFRQGCFTLEEKQLLMPGMLVGFLQSDLGKRMLQAKRICREWHFTRRLAEGSYLQGILDCAFLEEDGWVIVDYKTDRIRDPQAFAEHYRPQLQLYAEALAAIDGRPVIECSLFSLRRKEAFRVL